MTSETVAEQAPSEDVPPASGSKRASSWQALADGRFRRYFGSNALFLFGQSFVLLSSQWLIVNLTSSRTLLSLLSTLQGGAGFVFAPIGGALADSMPRRHILTVCRIGLALIVCGLAALVYWEQVAVWHVLAAALAMGVLMALAQASTQTYVFDIVGPRRLQSAVALNTSMNSVFGMAGPVMGGGIIALGGVGLAFALGGGIYLGALLLLLTIPVLGMPVRSGGGRRNMLRDVVEGFRYARGHRPTFWIIVLTSMTVLTAGQQVLRPAYARDVLDVGSSGLSLMVTLSAAGALMGAFLVGPVSSRFHHIGYGLALSMVAKDVCFVVFAFSRSFPLTLTMEFLAGLAGPYFLVTATTYLQTSAPEEMRGRTMGLLWMMFQLNAFGALLAGLLADATTETFSLAFGSIARICALMAVLAVAAPLRRLTVR